MDFFYSAHNENENIGGARRLPAERSLEIHDHDPPAFPFSRRAYTTYQKLTFTKRQRPTTTWSNLRFFNGVLWRILTE